MGGAHYFLLLLLLLFSGCEDFVDPIITQSQSEFTLSKRANIWYFGQKSGLDFNNLDSNGNPSILTDGQINTNEGCSVMCDKNGSLLFYTDGVTVWSRFHEIMPNGTGLKGSFTSTQSALIVPHPGNTELYFIFTTAAQAQTDGLNYNLVDMTEDGGLGDVVLKNVQLYTPTTEKLTAVHQPNGDDVWVISHQWESDAFFVYSITEEGLNEIPVISRTGSIHEFGTSDANTIGEMKASPSGQWIALNISENLKTEIFNFNKQTGTLTLKQSFVTSIKHEEIDGSLYGLTFSPNERYLYFTESAPLFFSGQYVFQYDIEKRTTTKVDTVRVGGGMQLGPDNKIYTVSVDSEDILVLERPNLPVGHPGFKIHSLSISPGRCLYGIPNFIQSYLSNPDPIVDMPNVFTPNGDGVNDILKPKKLADVETFEMKIMDRTGVEIFATSNQETWWDGANIPNGIFYWSIMYDGVNGYSGELNGWVQLLR